MGEPRVDEACFRIGRGHLEGDNISRPLSELAGSHSRRDGDREDQGEDAGESSEFIPGGGFDALPCWEIFDRNPHPVIRISIVPVT